MSLRASAAPVTNVEITALATCVVGCVFRVPPPIANHTLSLAGLDPLAGDFAPPSILLTRWIALDAMHLVAVHRVLRPIIWINSRELSQFFLLPLQDSPLLYQVLLEEGEAVVSITVSPADF